MMSSTRTSRAGDSKYSAAADVVGQTTLPFSAASPGAAIPTAVLADQLLAVANGSSVFVIALETLETIAVLSGAHLATVTDVCWSPECWSRDLKARTHLLLVSSDDAGEVIVWNVTTGQPISRSTLSFVIAGSKDRSKGGGSPVVGVAWVLPVPCVVAALMAPADLVFWDSRSDAVLHTESLSRSEVFTDLLVDPWDASCLALVSLSGSIVLVQVQDLAARKLKVTTHTLPISGNGMLRVRWAPTRSILLLLYSDRITVFDTEYGLPLASTPLPGHCAPFKSWLAVEGSGSTLGTGDDGGFSLLVCQHENGNLSVWRTVGNTLTYGLAAYHTLTPTFRAASLGDPVSVLEMVPMWPPFRALPQAPARPRATTGAPPAQSPMINMSAEADAPGPGGLVPSLLEQFSNFAFGSSESSSPSAAPVAGVQPAGADSAPAARTAAPSQGVRELGVVALMSQGQCWTWSVPIPPAEAQAGGDKGRPERVPKPLLREVFTGLPSAITDMAVFPHLVSTKSMPALHRFEASSAQRGSQSERPEGSQEGEGASPEVGPPRQEYCMPLIAVGTRAGTVDLLTVCRGVVQPFAIQPVASYKVAKTRVASVQWMGSTLRVAVLTSSKGKDSSKDAKDGGKAAKHMNMVTLVDFVSGRSEIVLDRQDDSEPLVVIRPSPSGRYLISMPAYGAAELFLCAIGSPPSRIRSMELPFISLAWSVPQELATGPSRMWTAEMEAVAALPDALSEERARRTNSSGGQVGAVPPGWRITDEAKPLMPAESISVPDAAAAAVSTADNTPLNASRFVAADQSTPDLPSPQATLDEAVVFALRDGRLGCLGVHDRGVRNRVVKRAHWSVQLVDSLVITSVSAVGPLVLLGDGDGIVYQWDTASGRTMVHPSSRKLIKKMQIAPPASEHLFPDPMRSAAQGRMAVLYGDGAFEVWEMSRSGQGSAVNNLISKLQPGHATYQDTCHVGRIAELSWLPLPAPIGGGSVAVLLTQTGNLLLMDVATPAEMRPSPNERIAALHYLSASGPHSSAASSTSDGGAPPTPRLAPPRPCSSLLLAKRAHALILRSIVQAGVPPTTLLALVRSTNDEATDIAQGVLHQLLGLDPPSSAPSPAPEFDLLGLDGDAAAVAATTREAADGIPRKLMRSFKSNATLLQSLKPASLASMLKDLARSRGGPAGVLLLPAEEAAYEAALQQGTGARGLCARMAVAATMLGTNAEARFWTRLVDTLAALQSVAATREAEKGVSGMISTVVEDRASASMDSSLWNGFGSPPAGITDTTLLLSERLLVLEARSRVEWHEQMDTPAQETDRQRLHDRRVLEYVAIGDFETAVGMLMACNPEPTKAYYRNSLLTMALAAATGPAVDSRRDDNDGGYQEFAPTYQLPVRRLDHPTWASRTIQRRECTAFHLQAAKVVAIHASSIGDSLLGVPLLCSVGLFDEAAALLQADGAWRLAAVLSARTLSGKSRSLVLQAWAQHLLRRQGGEGGVWRAVGMLIAAGCLHTALKILKAEGLLDCAQAFVAACHDMRLVARVSANATSSDGDATRHAVSFTYDDLACATAPDASANADRSQDRVMLLLPNLFSDVMVPTAEQPSKVAPPTAGGGAPDKAAAAKPPSLGVTGERGEALVDGDGFELVDHADDVRLVMQQYDGYLSDILHWIR